MRLVQDCKITRLGILQKSVEFLDADIFPLFSQLGNWLLKLLSLNMSCPEIQTFNEKLRAHHSAIEKTTRFMRFSVIVYQVYRRHASCCSQSMKTLLFSCSLSFGSSSLTCLTTRNFLRTGHYCNFNFRLCFLGCQKLHLLCSSFIKSGLEDELFVMDASNCVGYSNSSCRYKIGVSLTVI